MFSSHDPIRRPSVAKHALFALALAAAGCSDDFVGLEMNLDEEDKPRPLAIVLDPPEAAPGETVAVTLLWSEAHPDGAAVTWRVAQEYDPGIYGVNPVERRFQNLDEAFGLPAPRRDAAGFFRQTFSYTVPDSILLWSEGLARAAGDVELAPLIQTLLPGSEGRERDAIDAYLRELDGADLAALGPAERALVTQVADVFAAQIRFRATLSRGIRVDVTKALTVRYARPVGSANANTNPQVASWSVVALPEYDAEWEDWSEGSDGVVRTPIALGAEPVTTEVVRTAGWTYYLVAESTRERYNSPFAGPEHAEEAEFLWFWRGLGAVSGDFALLVGDDGEEVDMPALDEAVRLAPPDGPDAATFRVYLVLRDGRPEWEGYAGTPGMALGAVDLTFR